MRREIEEGDGRIGGGINRRERSGGGEESRGRDGTVEVGNKN